MKVLRFFLLLSLAFAHETISSDILPSPVALDYTRNTGIRLNEFDDELKLQCSSWRFAAEANNLSPWKTIPQECADYVKDYMRGRGYLVDLERVFNESAYYASNVELNDDGKDVWIFDVDETLLSNLPYYAEHGYGFEIFDHAQFDKWVEEATSPPIESSLKLYQTIMELGFKIFLLTGRSERNRLVTIKNLEDAGFHKWDKLILRSSDDQGKLATVYKSEKRDEMVKDGYRIVGNSGDQWSDLLGSSVSSRSFKLPNPMYYIP